MAGVRLYRKGKLVECEGLRHSSRFSVQGPNLNGWNDVVFVVGEVHLKPQTRYESHKQGIFYYYCVSLGDKDPLILMQEAILG